MGGESGREISRLFPNDKPSESREERAVGERGAMRTTGKAAMQCCTTASARGARRSGPRASQSVAAEEHAASWTLFTLRRTGWVGVCAREV